MLSTKLADSDALFKWGTTTGRVAGVEKVSQMATIELSEGRSIRSVSITLEAKQGGQNVHTQLQFNAWLDEKMCWACQLCTHSTTTCAKLKSAKRGADEAVCILGATCAEFCN